MSTQQGGLEVTYGSNGNPPGNQQRPSIRGHRRGSSGHSSLANMQEFLANIVRKETDPIRRVSFDGSSHVSVLFQMHGSVWPMVLPYCLINILVTYSVYWLKTKGIDLTCASSGHTFMSMMVAFLVVSRTQITYSRFMEARCNLSTLYKSCRELMHFTCCLTMEDTGEPAKQWRRDVAYKTILLLRVTMATLEHQSSQQNPWDISELDTEEKEALEDVLILHTPDNVQGNRIMKWAHGTRTISDENFRAPIVLALELRKEIMKQRNGKYLKERMHVNEELKILQFVSEYVMAFHGLKALITTPFPFPLVQMARTFLFFWVFTLPFSLAGDFVRPIQLMVIIFFVTYGFIGLEYVSIELDDPFGDDPNDFDDLGMAQMVFEDIYITLYKMDGSRSADLVRKKIIDRMERNALESYRTEHMYGSSPLKD